MKKLAIKKAKPYTRTGPHGQLVQVSGYDSQYVASTHPAVADAANEHVAQAARVVTHDHHGDVHRTLTSFGFSHHGQAPHAMTMEHGDLYQHPQKPGHFVHAKQDGAWSSFHSDGATHTLKKNGKGSLALHMHLTDDCGHREPKKGLLARMMGKSMLVLRTGRTPKGETESTATSYSVLSKSDYERTDPRTGKIQHVHDSRTSSGKKVHDIEHPVYRTPEKPPKYNSHVTPLSAHGDDGGKMLARRLPSFTKQDHLDAAAHHKAMSEHHHGEWGKHQRAAHMETFGSEPQFHDYKVSGIGRDEYSDHHKEALRYHAHTASSHGSAAHAHEKAAGMRGLPKDDHAAVLARHGWESLGKRGGTVGSGAPKHHAYAHPAHPGHVVRVTGDGDWGHEWRDRGRNKNEAGKGPESLANHLKAFHKAQ